MVTELGKLFPSIPLVAEEDSAFVHSNNLEDPVVKAVTRQASAEDKPWTHDDVLKAIDRGGKEAFTFGTKPATYWVGLTSSYTVGTITHPVFLCLLVYYISVDSLTCNLYDDMIYECGLRVPSASYQKGVLSLVSFMAF